MISIKRTFAIICMIAIFILPMFSFGSSYYSLQTKEPFNIALTPSDFIQIQDTDTPTPISTVTDTPTPTSTETPTPTFTLEPSNTPTDKPTETPTFTLVPPSPTITFTRHPTATEITPTVTITRNPTATEVIPTVTYTRQPTATNTRTITPTATNTQTPTRTPWPTRTPTKTDTPNPTDTITPTITPRPTYTPEPIILTPTETPTSTITKTLSPTDTSTIEPSITPTITPIPRVVITSNLVIIPENVPKRVIIELSSSFILLRYINALLTIVASFLLSVFLLRRRNRDKFYKLLYIIAWLANSLFFHAAIILNGIGWLSVLDSDVFFLKWQIILMFHLLVAGIAKTIISIREGKDYGK